MEKKETFRFGVMGAGNISNKFCDAAEKTEEVCVTAVAARSEERAREFAEKYEIHTYYGNYEEIIVYCFNNCSRYLYVFSHLSLCSKRNK